MQLPVPEIGRLPHPAAAVPVDFGEAAIFGPIGKIVTEVPFSEMSRGITRVCQHLRDGDLVLPQHGAAVDGMPDAGAIGPVTSQERCPRR